MDSTAARLRIVVMDCPYDSWTDGITGPLFAQTMGLKLRGYRDEYPYGVLPLDTSDFVANHQLICRTEDDGRLTPILGCRSITYERCRTHNLPFSGVALCRAAQAPAHAERVEEIVQRAMGRGHSISYDGSWTIDPAIREDRELTKRIRSMFVGLYVLFHQEYGIQELVAGGTLRFKMHQVLQHWGFNPLASASGETMPPIAVTSLMQEPVQVMHLEQFSQAVCDEAAQWKLMWKNRLTIASPAQAKELLVPVASGIRVIEKREAA